MMTDYLEDVTEEIHERDHSPAIEEHEQRQTRAVYLRDISFLIKCQEYEETEGGAYHIIKDVPDEAGAPVHDTTHSTNVLQTTNNTIRDNLQTANNTTITN